MGVDAIDQTICPSVLLTYIVSMYHTILYSYLMGVDAIDQSICPEVLGMTKCSIA
jgi:hypothetical protein